LQVQLLVVLSQLGDLRNKRLTIKVRISQDKNMNLGVVNSAYNMETVLKRLYNVLAPSPVVVALVDGWVHHYSSLSVAVQPDVNAQCHKKRKCNLALLFGYYQVS